ncbi:hypothetical protein NSA31_22395 [Bacillus subtilis]|uniref:hypothetical protein n=1 Tax=Bacillus subtilis TaxID=1423 RepID=UPI002149CE6A|nr:hypothetical protein [Bacillus subtilis]MCR1994492.1 hypothetical protein [Bacillus subtilis]
MKPTITKEQLEEIRQRVEAVGGARWFVSDRTDVSYEYPPGSCEVHSVCMTSGNVYADFIANARHDIPVLLDHIAELESELKAACYAPLKADRKEQLRRFIGSSSIGSISLTDVLREYKYEEGDEDDNV